MQHSKARVKSSSKFESVLSIDSRPSTFSCLKPIVTQADVITWERIVTARDGAVEHRLHLFLLRCADDSGRAKSQLVSFDFKYSVAECKAERYNSFLDTEAATRPGKPSSVQPFFCCALSMHSASSHCIASMVSFLLICAIGILSLASFSGQTPGFLVW